jgi:hypothetical protein
MGTHEEAVNAIDHLESKFVWEGMESPMVVKWMDAALQRRRREQHLAAMRQGLVPNMAMGEWDNAAVQSCVRVCCEVRSRALAMGIETRV